MRYDDLIKRLNDPHRRLVLSDRQEAAEAIGKIVAILREYNEDDEFFDDEKTTGLSAEDCAGYLRAMATERRRIGDPSYVGLNASELDQAADVIERQDAELTFWRDGLSAEEVAGNMKLWDMQNV